LRVPRSNQPAITFLAISFVSKRAHIGVFVKGLSFALVEAELIEQHGGELGLVRGIGAGIQQE
jgi:hypothetical protein